MYKTFRFVAKTYGWGWTPSTWQGWLVTLGFVALTIVNLSVLPANNALVYGASEMILPWIVEVILIIVLIIICYWKGEKPGWRRGNKKQ